MKFAAALITVSAVTVGIATVLAPKSFNFADPKGVNSLSIMIDAPLEPVRGVANNFSGMITFDPNNPVASSGSIAVATKNVWLGSQAMTDAMLQEWALDAPKYPTIEFKIKKVRDVKKVKDGEWTATVDGDFSLHGVTKPLTVNATAMYLKDKIKARGGMEGVQGDLLQIRSKFSFNRKDFGVAPDLNTDVIGNKIDIDLSVIGVCPN